MYNYTDTIVDFVKAFPDLTATELSNKMHDKSKLGVISSILHRLTMRKKLKRTTNSNGTWIYRFNR